MQNLTKDPLLNLRKVSARLYVIPGRGRYDEKEIDLLVWLLGNSPALEVMKVSMTRPQEAGEAEKYIQLLKRILDSNFSRPYGPASVRVKQDEHV